MLLLVCLKEKHQLSDNKKLLSYYYLIIYKTKAKRYCKTIICYDNKHGRIVIMYFNFKINANFK